MRRIDQFWNSGVYTLRFGFGSKTCLQNCCVVLQLGSLSVRYLFHLSVFDMYSCIDKSGTTKRKLFVFWFSFGQDYVQFG
jgi:hypothetical protein